VSFAVWTGGVRCRDFMVSKREIVGYKWSGTMWISYESTLQWNGMKKIRSDAVARRGAPRTAPSRQPDPFAHFLPILSHFNSKFSETWIVGFGTEWECFPWEKIKFDPLKVTDSERELVVFTLTYVYSPDIYRIDSVRAFRLLWLSLHQCWKHWSET
jgi:hypothetical protein